MPTRNIDNGSTEVKVPEGAARLTVLVDDAGTGADVSVRVGAHTIKLASAAKGVVLDDLALPFDAEVVIFGSAGACTVWFQFSEDPTRVPIYYP